MPKDAMSQQIVDYIDHEAKRLTPTIAANPDEFAAIVALAIEIAEQAPKKQGAAYKATIPWSRIHALRDELARVGEFE